MGEIKLDGFSCERCTHIWIGRNGPEIKPVVCPRCKSPYWNTPRRAGQNGGVKEKEVIEAMMKKEEFGLFPPRKKT